MPEATPRGVRDFSPAEAISIRYITGVAEEVFKRFGFYPLETPAIENMKVLNAKAYGDEPAKEIYQLDGKEEGLRYDFTVPLARYVASNRDLTLPFKRYQIGTIWRRDEPQKMRYREFIQADIDTVGSNEVESDAEIIAAGSLALEQLGVRDYVVVVNSRPLLELAVKNFKAPQGKQMQIIRILDKMQKLSRSEVLEQLTKAGMAGTTGEELLNFIEQDADNEEKLEKMEANIEGAKEETGKMQALLSLLLEYKLSGKMVFDLSLARGLDYYTGFVWEFVIEEGGKRLPSVGGGGRYDNLIGIYSKKSIPATGCTLGITRLFDVLSSASKIKTYAKVFIAYLGAQNRSYAINAASTLRGNGVYVDLNATNRNLSKQLEYAASLEIKNVMIIGDKERAENKIKLRNMASGEEELISLQEAVERLKV